MSNNLYLQGYFGFGDSIYQYPFVKELSKQYDKIYLRTPFPQLFDSIPNVEFVLPVNTRLETCNESINKNNNVFKNQTQIEYNDFLIFQYQRPQRKRIGMAEAFNNLCPKLTQYPLDWTIPIKPKWIHEAKRILQSINTTKKICIIKPPSVRKEWYNIARVGNPKYFQYLVDKYKDQYYFVSVGNKKMETELQRIRGIDLHLDAGEISIDGIIALVAMSDLVIGYHSFIIAIGIATGTKTFCIFGGYIPPELWIDKVRMDMSKISYVSPYPFCDCFDRQHKKCNKEIPIETIETKFEQLVSNVQVNNKINYIPSPKEDSSFSSCSEKTNLLCSRIRAERCSNLADNQWIKNRFNIFTIDHTPVSSYNCYGDKFKGIFRFPYSELHLNNKYTDTQKTEIKDFCKDILIKNDIKTVINSHPLHIYNQTMKIACAELGVSCINTEMFCDHKMIFDWEGCQYTRKNEIYKYISKIPIVTDRTIIDYPKKTRQPQPYNITKEEFFKKYSLGLSKEYIVLLGQLSWDMSVIQSTNKYCYSYAEYINLILQNNPDTMFIVKPHPLDIGRGESEFINNCKNYHNVIIVNESLETLFNIFEYFTSFSSTTIFEGLLRNKKFATMGYHFCNNDKLVYQLRVPEKTNKLYNSLKALEIDNHILKQYIYFVCNYYTIKQNSNQIFYRLTMSSDEYFSRVF